MAGSAPAGGLTFTTSTRNPARCPRSAGLLSNYATSSAASRCRAYTLFVEADAGGRVLLAFEPGQPCGYHVDGLVLSGTGTIVPSGTPASCYQERKPGVSASSETQIRALNLESNEDSNFLVGGRRHAPDLPTAPIGENRPGRKGDPGTRGAS